MNVNPEQLGQIIAAQVEALVSARVDQAMQELDYKISAAAEDAWRQHEFITHEDDVPFNHPWEVFPAGGLDVDVANGYVRGPVGTIPEDLLVYTPTITLTDNATNYLYLKLHYDYQMIVSIPYGTSAVATNYRWEVMQGTGKDPVVINSTTPISIGGPTGTLAAFNEYIPVAKVITSGNVITSIEQFLTSNHVPVYQGWTDWTT